VNFTPIKSISHLLLEYSFRTRRYRAAVMFELIVLLLLTIEAVQMDTIISWGLVVMFGGLLLSTIILFYKNILLVLRFILICLMCVGLLMASVAIFQFAVSNSIPKVHSVAMFGITLTFTLLIFPFFIGLHEQYKWANKSGTLGHGFPITIQKVNQDDSGKSK
jgi:hypothetical protein